MASDYAAIREDHRRRYGEDVGDYGALLVDLYADRTHFVFELLQNAQDAGATRIDFELRKDRLDVRHDGRRFTEADVRGVCGIRRSTKAADDPDQIGRFGVGFKSVYAYTHCPQIHCGDEHFAIRDYVHPQPVDRVDLSEGWTTLQTFPFDRDDVDAKRAREEIAGRLSALSPRTILFLRNLRELTWSASGQRGTIVREEVADGNARRVRLLHGTSPHREEERWLVFDRPVQLVSDRPANHVELAFGLKTDRNGREHIVEAHEPRLVAFFPTARETHLGFLIQGPFIPTAARDNVREGDPINERLVAELASLTVEAMTSVKERGLLDVGFLECLPIDPAYFAKGSLLHPLYGAVRKALLEQPLLPTDDGRHLPAVDVRLARGTGLRDLISPAQLGAILGVDREIAWLSADISLDRTPDLQRYLAGYKPRSLYNSDHEIPPLVKGMELDAQAVVGRLEPRFLEQQPTDWMIRLYEWLSGQAALMRGSLREREIIRRSDGQHVAAFTGDQPQIWLPPEGETAYPVVDHEIASDDNAREFLTRLGLSEPDVVDEVLEIILPHYQGEYPDPADYASDLARIAHALVAAKDRRRGHLMQRLRETTFLVGQNAATCERYWLTPEELYEPTEQLEAYLAGNPNAWFLCDECLAHRDSWEALGLAKEIRVTRREPDAFGHVGVYSSHGYHERGRDRFDPDFEIDELEWALENITKERSLVIWRLLAAQKAPLHGTVEESKKKDYSGPRKEKQSVSPAGKLLLDAEWLLGTDGEWHVPHEVSLHDLDESYQRDEALATQLGMATSEGPALAEYFGIAPDEAALLRRHPDALRTAIEAAKRSEGAKQGPSSDVEDDQADSGENGVVHDEGVDVDVAIAAVFSQPGKTELPDWEGDGRAGNPNRRRTRAAEVIEQAQASEPASADRWRIVPRKDWEPRDPAVREYLAQTYGGRCQICGRTFPRRDGKPFFEAKYLVTPTSARWLDTPGNSLCLCPTCLAKMMYAAVEGPEVMDQLAELVAHADELPDGGSVHFQLSGAPVALRFAQRHLIDLGALLEGAADNHND